MTEDPAFEIEQRVRDEVATMRSTWVRLAALLHAFHEAKGWTLRSCDTFATWLGQPEIAVSQRQAYSLIAAWRELAIERGIGPEQLNKLDPSKLDVVLPAVRRGDVEVEEALSDCETLSRSDLREKYRGQGGTVEYHECPGCGHRHVKREREHDQ